MALSNVHEPRVMGRGLGLSPLIILISMIFWGWVLGPIGMLLAVPLTMAVKTTMEHGHDSRWIALLMGARPSRPAASRSEEEQPSLNDWPAPTRSTNGCVARACPESPAYCFGVKARGRGCPRDLIGKRIEKGAFR
ncbi:MAG: AI-2E family transporter [Phycisphaerales bacterium]|nr:MAG: AI-2E family transporter [Phycisphaerales bacterium]